jgi:hypothetical protein
MVLFKDCANLEHWFTLVVDCNVTQFMLHYLCSYDPKDLCSKLIGHEVDFSKPKFDFISLLQKHNFFTGSILIKLILELNSFV